MQPVTKADLQELRQRGYDPETLRRLEQQAELHTAALQVVAQIEQAFRSVRLDGGIGLWEAQGLDDYASEAELARCRLSDEKEDWRRFSSGELVRCQSSLSFFDAAGMRFHLPAFLADDLRNLNFQTVFSLTYDEGFSREKFALLSPEQRQAVRAYLGIVLQDPGSRCDWPKVRANLAGFWADETGTPAD